MMKLCWPILLVFLTSCHGTPQRTVTAPAQPNIKEVEESRATFLREEFATSVVGTRPPRPKPSVSLTWDDAPGAVGYYRVFAGMSTGNWKTNWLVMSRITNAQGQVFTNTITLTNLATHPYTFAVVAGNASIESAYSNPAWFQMNSNGTVWSNAFFWLAPSNRTSIVQASHLMPPTWTTVFSVTPSNDAIFAVTGPMTNQWYFRRLVQ